MEAGSKKSVEGGCGATEVKGGWWTKKRRGEKGGQSLEGIELRER